MTSAFNALSGFHSLQYRGMWFDETTIPNYAKAQLLTTTVLDEEIFIFIPLFANNEWIILPPFARNDVFHE